MHPTKILAFVYYGSEKCCQGVEKNVWTQGGTK